MKTNGTIGEQYAVIAFKQIHWTMFRTQPETKWIGDNKLIPMTSEGTPDFMGYDNYGRFVACEVKESDDSKYPATIPCSRLTKTQREWMNKHANNLQAANHDKISPYHGCYVFVYWLKLKYGTLFKYKSTGSYRIGEGINL